MAFVFNGTNSFLNITKYSRSNGNNRKWLSKCKVIISDFGARNDIANCFNYLLGINSDAEPIWFVWSIFLYNYEQLHTLRFINSLVKMICSLCHFIRTEQLEDCVWSAEFKPGTFDSNTLLAEKQMEKQTRWRKINRKKISELFCTFQADTIQIEWFDQNKVINMIQFERRSCGNFIESKQTAENDEW